MPNDVYGLLYYEKTLLGKPRETLVRSLDLFHKKNFIGKCMYIGNGVGNDS